MKAVKKNKKKSTAAKQRNDNTKKSEVSVSYSEMYQQLNLISFKLSFERLNNFYITPEEQIKKSA